MRLCVFLAVSLCGCATTVQSEHPPTGKQLFLALIESSNILLSGEPLCNMNSLGSGKKQLQLKDHFATVMSSSYDNHNTVTVESSCSKSKHDSRDAVIDIWDCNVVFNELSAEGGFVSSSSISISLDRDSYEYIAPSLRCF